MFSVFYVSLNLDPAVECPQGYLTNPVTTTIIPGILFLFNGKPTSFYSRYETVKLYARISEAFPTKYPI